VSRSHKLTKQAREYITGIMTERGGLSTEDAVELIRPHLLLDPQELIRAETLRVVQRIMRGIRGKTGKRACFNYKDGADSQYVNIETTESIQALNGVEKQLDGQFIGLIASKKRITKRRSVLINKKRSFPVTEDKQD